ncbi:MAG: MDR family oxidoreductase [Bauldia sp.]
MAGARFKALIVRRDEATKAQTAAIEEIGESDLMEGNVTVAVRYSTVNYKDGLAITGKLPVVRRFPMIPGIDFAGTVTASTHPDFNPGDEVVLNGWGVGEVHYGAFAGMARVNGDWLIRKPEGLTLKDTMAIGTAGYTAMLAAMALEKAGISPAAGKVAVTGAAGGVGSMAVTVLSALHHPVVAVTGRPEEAPYLQSLGAGEVIPRSELTGPVKPLAKERFAGAVDSCGGVVLANLLSMIGYGGAVAAVGNAAGSDLPTSVAPFILRAVSLIGIDSVRQPKAIRFNAWHRLAHLMNMEKLAAMTHTIGFAGIEAAARDVIAGKIRGRVVVDMEA